MYQHIFEKVNYEELSKDNKIKSIVRHLSDKFGGQNFKIKDYWDGDLCAIGMTDNEEKYLIYVSVFGDNDFYVSLENLRSEDDSDSPYEPAGDFNDVT
ncbi:hypothetical protein [Sporocytophaga myxococcoides]|uniref:hypothetical protein n=1 Tax=Sporocytophaga myxococcoides TaxID=153721 RepID=UPI0003FA9DE9|nr:hypothetical protein [Sporocytophaga myxococcoides]